MMMEAKVSLTTACNAKCATCPVWRTEPEHMTVQDWRVIWRKLNESDHVPRILLNNTGDVTNHPDRDAILKVLKHGKRKWVAMTTNATLLEYVPDGVDELVISFNGGTRAGYERTTGLPFEETVARIRSLYPEFAKLRKLEMHCLMWDGNQGEEDALLELWHDFPGRIRLSYKYDNQGRQDHTLEGYRTDDRIPCDYLYRMICVYPRGAVRMCAHDFEGSEDLGNLVDQSVAEVIDNRRRLEKLHEHVHRRFTGICERCNYNRPVSDGLVKYVR